MDIESLREEVIAGKTFMIIGDFSDKYFLAIDKADAVIDPNYTPVYLVGKKEAQ